MNRRESNTTDSNRDISDDADLFERHLHGDHDALLALFDRFQEPLWLYVAKLAGGREAADEIMQQCWERIIRLRTKQNDPPQNVRAYLFRTVRNIFLNSRRSKRVMVDFDDAEPTDRLVSRMDEKSRDEELLEMALRELPDLQREILVLNAWSGFSFDEIAEMFDKKPGAIHTMAWRARKDLLAIMIRLRQRDGGD